MPRRRRSTRARGAKDHVVVSSPSYGKALRGTKIYFEGARPSTLKSDGTIKFGKHILQLLGRKYQRFRWVITEQESSIREERGIVRVRTSLQLLRRMDRENWDRTRDIKNEIVRRFFGIAYPGEFESLAGAPYVPGTLAGVLAPGTERQLSGDDKDALARFIPAFISTEAASSVTQIKATAELESLRALATDLEREIARSHSESWWQDYVKRHILLMQQGYIKSLDKLNVAVGNTKFPDFCLITHDSYLDILEIKKPDTTILKLDPSRDNYHWDTEMARAIIQVENYIEQVSNKADAVRTYLLDRQQITMKAVVPRGIILAGNANGFDRKQKDDLRLLSKGLSRVAVLTYDELLTRLKNYLSVVEEFGKSPLRLSGSGKARHRATRNRRGPTSVR